MRKSEKESNWIFKIYGCIGAVFIALTGGIVAYVNSTSFLWAGVGCVLAFAIGVIIAKWILGFCNADDP